MGFEKTDWVNFLVNLFGFRKILSGTFKWLYAEKRERFHVDVLGRSLGSFGGSIQTQYSRCIWKSNNGNSFVASTELLPIHFSWRGFR